MTAEKLLSPGEVAERLGVAVSWIYVKAEQGAIPSRKVGRYRKFLWSEIAAWLETCREGPVKAPGITGRVTGKTPGGHER